MFRKHLENIKRIVIKIGSNAITKEDGGVDQLKMKHIFKDIINLRKTNKDLEIIIVCSGAIQTARGMINLNAKNKISSLQAYSSIGQWALSAELGKFFKKNQMNIGQVLLTHDDFKNSARNENIKNTLNVLLNNNVIPVINENDTVSYEEIAFGDNDQLAALVAQNISADLLILLTTPDGVYDKDPLTSKDATTISLIPSISAYKKISINTKGKTKAGKGGMSSKLLAAEIAVTLGVKVLIGSFIPHRPVSRLLKKNETGTLFLNNESEDLRIKSRGKKTLLTKAKKNAAIVIDRGAYKALAKGSSLLIKGVSKVIGPIKEGDCIFIKYQQKIIGCGIVNFDGNEMLLALEESQSMMCMHANNIYVREAYE